MNPPEPVHKHKGRRTMLRRRDVDEEVGFKKGKVSRKGFKITCSICGATGHNKRFHGSKGNRGNERPASTSDPCGTAKNIEDAENNPMDVIDPLVLEEHYQQVDQLRSFQVNTKHGAYQQPEADIPSQVLNVSHEGLSSTSHQGVHSSSQVIETSQQSMHNSSQVTNTSYQELHNSLLERRGDREKLVIRGGKKQIPTGVSQKSLDKAKEQEKRVVGIAKNKITARKAPTPFRSPMLRPRMNDKPLEAREKEGEVGKKRRIWKPPGLGASTASAHGKTS
ncbi:uncharacterized protein LOC120277224 [Dioscorea cayenensis subsp. rotundata]|uniref:Uncharacterized protein LOC120277224 n=1 Tax=Dioscorea cayennensis subsp. rotundata TaxID=55577 RepID=A0AB40CJ35_DIOCR|nr:uncharacterized protein LOC120277224 [Dioscorea cayenensis subsp. rotundata]